MGRIGYFVACFLMFATASHAASVVGSDRFDRYSTSTQGKLDQKADISYVDSSIAAASPVDGSIGLAKLADISTASLLGRNTAGTGVPEVLSAGTAKSLLAITQDDVMGLKPTDSPTLAKLGVGVTPVYRLDVYGATKQDGIQTNIGINMKTVPNINLANGDLSLMSGGTNLGIGAYKYTVRYGTGYGNTGTTNSGGGTAIITTDASNRKVLINLPVSSSPKVTKRIIYRTKVGASSPIYKLTTINNNTTTTYTDDTADTSLTDNLANYYGMPNYTTAGLMFDEGPILNLDGTNGGLAIGINSGNPVNVVGEGKFSIGYYALGVVTTGRQNLALGVNALRNLNTGGFNSFIGNNAGYWATTANYNTALGYFSLYGSSGAPIGSYNTVLGAYAGSIGIGSRNVFLGGYAGRYETGDDTLIIDSSTSGRTDEATARTGALIYGKFNTTPANQTLTINGKLGVGAIAPTAVLEVNGTIASTPSTATVTSVSSAIPITSTNCAIGTTGAAVASLADGVTAGQMLNLYIKSVSAGTDTLVITPAHMLGGTTITFAASPLGHGCTLVWSASGWVVVGINGGTVG